jgi:uncharacterized hydrophobic protein (TIGR00271 family)
VSGRLARLFDLRQDQDSPEAIDESVRAGVRFAGTNLWVLFFAILVASVGLNVNSTAVIIGAMLISPLMGPIVGVGYGAAINDIALIRRALTNLAIFIVLSLLTSVLYFLVSPLEQPGSELLARTTPNLWDVLIAAFGGAAGMVGLTRRGFTNVVPGVAIATALMPPLCTVGFGLANARWDMAAGAAYLFVINGVFIAAATLAVAKLLRLPPLASLDEIARARSRGFIALALTAVLVPAVWLGWRFAQQEFWVAQARALVAEVQSDPAMGLVAHTVDAAQARLELVVVGESAEARVRAALPTLERVHEGLAGRIALRRVGDSTRLASAGLPAQAMGDLALQIDRLRAEVAVLRNTAPAAPQADERLFAELRAQWPQVAALTLAAGQRRAEGAASAEDRLVVMVELPRPLPAAEAARLTRWLQARWPQSPLHLVEDIRAAR